MLASCHILAGRRSAMLFASALAFAVPVIAQQSTVGGLDEVIVTARKRIEKLQDVPMSITTIPSQEIEKLGLNSVADVSRLDASLIYDKGYSATDNRISIRGLSPTRGRVTVAVLVDGIDTSSEPAAPMRSGSVNGSSTTGASVTVYSVVPERNRRAGGRPPARRSARWASLRSRQVPG